MPFLYRRSPIRGGFACLYIESPTLQEDEQLLALLCGSAICFEQRSTRLFTCLIFDCEKAGGVQTAIYHMAMSPDGSAVNPSLKVILHSDE